MFCKTVCRGAPPAQMRRTTIRVQRRLASSVSIDGARDKRYRPKPEGTPGTDSFRVFVEDAQTKRLVSPLHDILPLIEPKKMTEMLIQTVIEIPRDTDAKMEVSKDEAHNPIKQDLTKDGKLRFLKHDKLPWNYATFLKHGKLPWNYGYVPRSFLGPETTAFGLKQPADSDPLDVIEIGEKNWSIGDVVNTRVLGAICLIDQGEADWKIVTISESDPLASVLHDIRDVELRMDGLLDRIREFYRVYKIAEGKAENKFAFGGKFLGREEAHYLVQLSLADYFRWDRFHEVVTKKSPDVMQDLIRLSSEMDPGLGAGMADVHETKTVQEAPEPEPDAPPRQH